MENKPKFIKYDKAELHPTWEFKKYFLDTIKNTEEFKKDRYDSTERLLKKVTKWEIKYHKPVYNFTLEENTAMFIEFNSGSEMSLMAQKSNLQYYVLFACTQNVTNSKAPSILDLKFDEIKKFINPIASEQRYVTRDEIYDLVEASYNENNEIVSGLVNPIDQANILLIFEGISGKANADISNLKWRDIDFENGIVKYTKYDVVNKIVKNEIGNDEKVTEFIPVGEASVNIPLELATILDRANSQEEYILNNGLTSEKARRTKVEIMDRYESEYFFRPVTYKNDGSNRLSGNAMQRRILVNCKEWLNRPYLTVSSIATSGMIDRAIRYTLDELNREEMRLTDFMNWVRENDEKANIQSAYVLYQKMYREELAKIIEAEKEE